MTTALGVVTRVGSTPVRGWEVWPTITLLVVRLELEAVEASGNGPAVEEPEISEDDGTFTQRLRRQV